MNQYFQIRIVLFVLVERLIEKRQTVLSPKLPQLGCQFVVLSSFVDE